jgi:hypothetical protein
MKTEPRYIHIKEKTKHGNGITVAYSRYDNFIYFAYSLVSKDDQYDKAIGRTVALEQYNKNAHHSIDQYNFIDKYNRCGVITMDTVEEHSPIRSIIADQAIRGLSLKDFKHTFISSIIASYIETSL